MFSLAFISNNKNKTINDANVSAESHHFSFSIFLATTYKPCPSIVEAFCSDLLTQK